MTIGYASLTITDLLDTATYIYYSPNLDDDYSGATIAPGQDSKYIGIYSGPTLPDGQPEPGTPAFNEINNPGNEHHIEWMEAKGEKGDKGDPGDPGAAARTEQLTTYKATLDLVQPDENETWHDDQDEAIEKDVNGKESGIYIWAKTTFTNYSGENPTSSYSSYSWTYIPERASAYRIETEYEEVYKFVESVEGSKTNYVFSPEKIEIVVKDFKDEYVDITSSEDNFHFEYLLNYSYKSDTTAIETYKDVAEILIENDLIEDNKKVEGTEEIITGKVILLQEAYNLGMTNTSNEDLFILSKMLIKDEEYNKRIETVLIIRLYKNDILVALKPVLIPFGTTADAAIFNIHVTGFNAAMRDTSLNFSEAGLSLTGGDLVIRNENGENVFYGDDEGNLYLIGTINATNGSFSGKIEANSGTIGGFEIISQDGEDYLRSKNGKIKLDGTNNKIIAETIELGTGATISEYITLGNASIKNPAKNDEGIFIEAGTIKIKQDGTINAGSITINGNDSLISLGDSIYLDGVEKELRSDSWSINPDKATFNNIVAKGSIQASCFEYGKVQTVGGILFVKTSAYVSDIEEIGENEVKLILEQEKINDNGLFNVNDVIILSQNVSETSINNIPKYTISSVGKDSIIDSITGEETGRFKDYIIIEATYNEIEENFTKSFPIIKLYSPDETTESKMVDNYGIIINSTNNPAFAPSQCISLVKLVKNKDENNEYKYEYEKKLLLGKLDENSFSNSFKMSGYGLYADNVFLKGLLASIDESGRNSGINSNGQGIMGKPDNAPWTQTDGKIVLWAGNTESVAPSKGEVSNNAPFRVDHYGNLYAASGYFKGAIITDSIIQGTKIKTAVIEGTGTGDFGLQIQNVSNGILFTDSYSDPNNIKKFFVLKDTETNIDTDIVKIKNLSIDSDTSYYPNSFGIGNLKIKNNRIGFFESLNEDTIDNSEIANNFISFGDNEINCLDKLKVTSGSTSISNNFLMDSGGTVIEYNYGKVKIELIKDNGYDVYISE